MNYRSLGDTGLQVSEIGFGAWGIGGGEAAPAYGTTDDRRSIHALQRAFELGINFFDTADFYGDGHSETLISQALGDHREEIVIASKVGLVDANGAQNFSPGYIRSSAEGSLRRLQTDYIDLYQLHGPPIHLLEEEDSIISTLHDLKDSGKVREIGISVASPEDGLAAVTRFGFRAIQVNFNLVDQRALEIGLLDLCRQKGSGVIGRTPLCYGFLSGAYSAADKFQPNDHRSGRSPEQINKWTNANSLFAPVLSQESKQTQAQLALRFCLSYEAVSTVIPGMLSRCEVEENGLSSDLGPLPKGTLDGLEGIYQANSFFVGG